MQTLNMAANDDNKKKNDISKSVCTWAERILLMADKKMTKKKSTSAKIVFVTGNQQRTVKE